MVKVSSLSLQRVSFSEYPLNNDMNLFDEKLQSASIVIDSNFPRVRINYSEILIVTA